MARDEHSHFYCVVEFSNNSTHCDDDGARWWWCCCWWWWWRENARIVQCRVPIYLSQIRKGGEWDALGLGSRHHKQTDRQTGRWPRHEAACNGWNILPRVANTISIQECVAITKLSLIQWRPTSSMTVCLAGLTDGRHRLLRSNELHIFLD